MERPIKDGNIRLGMQFWNILRIETAMDIDANVLERMGLDYITHAHLATAIS